MLLLYPGEKTSDLWLLSMKDFEDAGNASLSPDLRAAALRRYRKDACYKSESSDSHLSPRSMTRIHRGMLVGSTLHLGVEEFGRTARTPVLDRLRERALKNSEYSMNARNFEKWFSVLRPYAHGWAAKIEIADRLEQRGENGDIRRFFIESWHYGDAVFQEFLRCAEWWRKACIEAGILESDAMRFGGQTTLPLSDLPTI